MTESCYLGLDLGTSGCRAVAIDATGGLVTRATVPLEPPLQRPGGGVEQAPELWWNATLEVLRILAAGLTRHRPVALALDATATTLLLADPDGEPLGPAMMYNDQRARTQAARLDETTPPASPARGASSSLAKLLYLLERHDPRPGTLVLHQADWIVGKLGGRFGVSDWNNCLKLGFDPQREAWPDWLSRLDLRGTVLPEVLPPGTPISRLSPPVAAITGLPADLWLCAGTTDSTAAALAAGIYAPGDGVSVLGSTLVVKMVGTRPITDPAHGVYSHRIGKLWLAGGASNSGAAVLRHFFGDDRITALSARLRPDEPTGLDYYPLLRPGERFPHSDPSLAPRLTPRPADDARFFQGLLEGVARIETEGYRLLETLGAERLRTVASIGGGASNTGWARIRERLLGVPVSAARQQEAAYGAALLAKGDA